jgi:hypothetical protein
MSPVIRLVVLVAGLAGCAALLFGPDLAETWRQLRARIKARGQEGPR